MCESKLEGVDEMTKTENLGRKERKEEARAEIGESQMVRFIESPFYGDKTGLH